MEVNKIYLFSTLLTSILFLGVSILSALLYSKYNELKDGGDIDTILSPLEKLPQQTVTFGPLNIIPDRISLSAPLLTVNPVDSTFSPQSIVMNPAAVNFGKITPDNMDQQGVQQGAPLSTTPQPNFSLSDTEIPFNNLVAFLQASPLTEKLLEALRAFISKKSLETYAPFAQNLLAIISKPLASHVVLYADSLMRNEKPASMLNNALFFLANGYSHFVNAVEFVELKLNESEKSLIDLGKEFTHSSIKEFVTFSVDRGIRNFKGRVFNELYLYSLCLAKAESFLNQLRIDRHKESKFINLFETVFKPLKVHYAGYFLYQKYHILAHYANILPRAFDELNDGEKGILIRMKIFGKFYNYFGQPGASLRHLIESDEGIVRRFAPFVEFINALRGTQFKFTLTEGDESPKLDYGNIFADEKWGNIKSDENWPAFENLVQNSTKLMVGKSNEDWDRILMSQLANFSPYTYHLLNNPEYYLPLEKEALEFNFGEGQNFTTI
jgi:hypothetical protein